MHQEMAPGLEVLASDSYSAPATGSLRRARVATSLLFLVDGMAFGTWAALIPWFQQKFSLSFGQLGWVLLGLILGAMFSMPLAGRLIATWGSRRVAFPAAIAFCGALPLLALAPSHLLLIVAAIFFGLAKGAFDVSINSQGVTVETATRKAIFSSFQGFWSLGGLSAAFLTGLAMTHGISATSVIWGMAGLLFLITLATRGSLLPDAKITSAPAKKGRFSLPEKRLLLLGSLSFLALFSEGVLLDWSAVYARTVTHVPVTTAPLAFAVFALCMAGGRFLGDRLVTRFGPATMLSLSGTCMVLGTAIASFLGTWTAVLIGFAVIGLGISNLVPVIFGAAGRTHAAEPGPAIAVASTIGYLGFLSGPPAIGMLANFAGLPSAFGLVAVFGTAIATFGRSVIRMPPSNSGPTGLSSQ